MPTPDVAIISPYPTTEESPGLGGVATYTAGLAGALATEGVSVEVIAPFHPGEVDRVVRQGSVTVSRRFEIGPRGLVRATAAARECGAPVVHLQHESFLYGGPASAPAVVSALGRLRVAQPRSVVTLHHVVDPHDIDRAFTAMHRTGLPPIVARAGVRGFCGAVRRLADATVVLERQFADVVPGAVVVPHGLPRPQHAGDRREGRARWGVDDDQLVVLCFGYLAPYKGLDLVLEAGRLASPEAVVVVAGGEHPRLARRESYGAALAETYGGTARFVGYVPDDGIATMFAAADVVALPYPRPFGSSGVLALALGHDRPVLLSRAMADAVGAFDCSVMASTAPSVAAQLRAFRRERGIRAAVLAAARRLAAGKAWEDVGRRHRRLYDEVIRCPSK